MLCRLPGSVTPKRCATTPTPCLLAASVRAPRFTAMRPSHPAVCRTTVALRPGSYRLLPDSVIDSPAQQPALLGRTALTWPGHGAGGRWPHQGGALLARGQAEGGRRRLSQEGRLGALRDRRRPARDRTEPAEQQAGRRACPCEAQVSRWTSQRIRWRTYAVRMRSMRHPQCAVDHCGRSLTTSAAVCARRLVLASVASIINNVHAMRLKLSVPHTKNSLF